MPFPQPTAQDIANAAYRKAVAAKETAECSEAIWMAVEALGAGYRPWMKLVLVDADHRRTCQTRQRMPSSFGVVSMGYRTAERVSSVAARSGFMPAKVARRLRQANRAVEAPGSWDGLP